MNLDELMQQACKARTRAYAPYSNFKVGAAVGNQAGRYVGGCNVENAAYGSTICAEAVALSQAILQGMTDITDIAVITDTQAAPCGNCRQLIAELAPGCNVHLATPDRTDVKTVVIENLLPDAFTSLD